MSIDPQILEPASEPERLSAKARPRLPAWVLFALPLGVSTRPEFLDEP